MSSIKQPRYRPRQDDFSVHQLHSQRPPQPPPPPPADLSRSLNSRIPTKSTAPFDPSRSRSTAPHPHPPQSQPSRSHPPPQEQAIPLPHVSRLARSSSRVTPSEPHAPRRRDAALSNHATRPAMATDTVISEAVKQSSITSPVMANSHRLSMLSPPAIHTPSLVSGSSASTLDSPRSHLGLRRKPSGAIDRFSAAKRSDSVGEGTGNDVYGDLVLGISVPPTSALALQHRHEDAAPESYNAPRTARRPMNPARTPDNAFPPGSMSTAPSTSQLVTSPAYSLGPSATPSTRYTDSPFSHVPTPSTASSFSPILTKSSSSPVRVRAQNMSSVGSESLLRNEVPLVREPSPAARPGTRNASVATQASKRTVPVPVPAKPAATTSDKTTRKKLTKSQQPAAVKPGTNQVYPELAHLNVEPPKSQKSLPPSRPSRDGMASIFEASNPSPVVQSDLPRLYTTYHKRTSSQETPLSGSSPSLKTRLGLSSKPASKDSLRIDSAISPPPAARSFNREPTPEATDVNARAQRRDSPAVGAESSPGKSLRFGFFSRKSKPEVAKVPDKPRRVLTKGPAAGTGHEGYGRFSSRGRSGSTASSNGVRSPSADSTTSSIPRPAASRKNSRASKDSSDLDDFLKERLTPVILRGSGSTVTSNTTTSMLDVPAVAPKHPSTSSSIMEIQAPPRLLPSAMHDAARTVSPEKRAPLERRDSFENLNRSVTEHKSPPVPAGRSLKRTSRLSRSPIRRDASPEQHTAVVETPLDAPSFSTDPFFGREGLWLRPAHAAEAPRRTKFSERAQAYTSSLQDQVSEENVEMVETGSQNAMAQHFAHYAIMDLLEPMDLDEMERIMYESDVSPRDSAAGPAAIPKMVLREGRRTSLLPVPRKRTDDSMRSSDAVSPEPPAITLERQDSADAHEVLHARKGLVRQSAQVVNIARSPSLSQGHTPTLRSVSPVRQAGIEVESDATPAVLGTPERTMAANNSSRVPRLSPVGRIPRVVSRRDRDRKLPDSSFSRPFARTQPRPSVKPPGSVYSSIRDMAASPTEFNSQQPMSATSNKSPAVVGEHGRSESNAAMYAEPTLAATRNIYDGPTTRGEFLSFASRKNSDQSHRTYSSSSGTQSWLNSLYNQPQLEDVWNEYNDFMDEMMPLKTPTTGSSLGAPFQYSNAPYDPPMVIPPISSPPPITDLPQVPDMSNLTPVLMSPPQFAKFLQASSSNLTSDTVSAFIDGYGSTTRPSAASLYSQHQRDGLAKKPSRASFPSARSSIASSQYSQPSDHSRPTSLIDRPARRKSSHAHLQRIPEAPPPQPHQPPSLKLRSGALVTSKLLSFGRVLFSPAHNEVQLAQDPRVLVLDGLSSDWSYFVAQAYPSATIYNLASPDDPAATNFWPDPTRPPPPNHKQIPFPSLAHAFPFPRGFFTAVVFRFPVASTEKAYQSAIFECNRVLRPGGHLEIALLDLDLMNMGNRARKAVRGLKTRLQTKDPNVCLANLSDVIIRLLGRRGFTDLYRCVVGVPASTSSSSAPPEPSSSRPSSLSSSTSTSSLSLSLPTLLAALPTNPTNPPPSSPSPTSTTIPALTDSSLASLISRVARWWYAACYERPASLPAPPASSIWADRALRQEVARHDAKFRLLIAHAQKPCAGARRTASV